MEAYLQVGVISNTHGIAGEVKVFPTTDDPRRFKKLKTVYLNPETNPVELHITQVKFVKNMVVLRFAEFDKIEQVQRLRNQGLFVNREQAVRLSANEYFIADLIGVDVYSTEEELLGRIKDVMQTGANDVYIVEREDGSELLLPAIKDCIKEVDLTGRRMKVFVMPGLLDL